MPTAVETSSDVETGENSRHAQTDGGGIAERSGQVNIVGLSSRSHQLLMRSDDHERSGKMLGLTIKLWCLCSNQPVIRNKRSGVSFDEELIRDVANHAAESYYV